MKGGEEEEEKCDAVAHDRPRGAARLGKISIVVALKGERRWKAGRKMIHTRSCHVAPQHQPPSLILPPILCPFLSLRLSFLAVKGGLYAYSSNKHPHASAPITTCREDGSRR